MFNDIITIFNYDGVEYHPTVVPNVELQYETNIERQVDYNSSNNTCLAIFKVYRNNEISTGKRYLPHELWMKSNKELNFTINVLNDFFIIGHHDIRHLQSYERLSLKEPSRNFLISGFREFRNILKHFEIIGS